MAGNLNGFFDAEDDEEHRACNICSGTGIGQHGDPDTSTCYACKGRGYVLPPADDYDDDAYERNRDRMIDEENGLL